MNGKTLKKKLMKHPLYGDRALVQIRIALHPLFDRVGIPAKPKKPEGWEDNLYVLDGWRRTLPHPEGGWETQIVEFGEDSAGIFGGIRTARHEDPSYLPNEWEVEDLPSELFEQIKARKAWEKKFLSGKENTEIPVLDALFGAGKFARATFASIHGEYLHVTFPVILPENKYLFSSALHKAFRIAKNNGVRIHFMRGF